MKVRAQCIVRAKSEEREKNKREKEKKKKVEETDHGFIRDTVKILARIGVLAAL
jgi:hypothetical protein